PRTFPAIVGIGLIVLGLFLAGQAVVRHRKDTLAEAGPGSAESAESAGSARTSAAGDGDGAAASAGESSVETAGRSSGEDGVGGIVLEAPPEPKVRKV